MEHGAHRTHNNGYIPAIGFATAAAMWTVGYIGRIPPATAPGMLLIILMAVCVIAGGWIAGRYSGRGILAGVWTGIVSALLNVLILGSVIGSEAGSALGIYLGASLFGSAILGAIGAAIGASSLNAQRQTVNWMTVFACTGIYTTFLLIIAGGLVTSFEAGLAVVDWPNTEGELMWLYPLARMTGGIFFEHSHRLIGTLVGLTVLTLAFSIQAGRWPVWLKRLAWAALALVIIQGVLGGLRVTGMFTTSTSAEVTQPNLYLAVVHGVVGQLFLCLIVALSVFVSTAWRECRSMLQHAAASTERGLSLTLVVLLVIQLVLGAILRHFAGGLHIHLTLAAIVLTVAITLGVRLWGIHIDRQPLPRLGKYLIWTACIQLGLGFLSLIATGSTADAEHPPVWMVVIATTHQTTGAVLLALATLALLWIRRILLLPAEPAGGRWSSI